MSSIPRARNQSQTSPTSRSGAEAPDVRPTVSTPSSQASSISATSSTRCASTPAAWATSTSRFEFEEFSSAFEDVVFRLPVELRRAARSAA